MLDIHVYPKMFSNSVHLCDICDSSNLSCPIVQSGEKVVIIWFILLFNDCSMIIKILMTLLLTVLYIGETKLRLADC